MSNKLQRSTGKVSGPTRSNPSESLTLIYTGIFNFQGFVGNFAWRSGIDAWLVTAPGKVPAKTIAAIKKGGSVVIMSKRSSYIFDLQRIAVETSDRVLWYGPIGKRYSALNKRYPGKVYDVTTEDPPLDFWRGKVFIDGPHGKIDPAFIEKFGQRLERMMPQDVRGSRP